MHEHIFVLTADVQQDYLGERGSQDEPITDAVTKLGALAAQGVRTIADPAVAGLGRNLPRIQRVAEQVPELNITVASPHDHPGHLVVGRGAVTTAIVLCHPDPRYYRALTCGASSPMASAATVTCQYVRGI
jgi:hypothetical protein